MLGVSGTVNQFHIRDTGSMAESNNKGQEALLRIADMMTWTYTAESLVLRVEELAGQRGEDAVAQELFMM